MEDTLKQAKLKALSLLNHKDRTEVELRQKLKEKGFDEEIIEKTIAYVKSFGYVNDLSYAERYILNKQNSKSKREIYVALAQRGISKEYIELAFQMSFESESEVEAIRRLCEKKHFSAENSTEVEKQKLYNYLARKGFHSEEIRQVLKV